MLIRRIVQYLETLAPPALQENYDNAGLLTGDKNAVCTGVLICLDSTEAIIAEAISKGCNLVVAHHPIIFKGLRSITGKDYVERTIVAAIKNDIAVYAMHTNLDNLVSGVNGRIADKLHLQHCRSLAPKHGLLTKLQVYVPVSASEKLLEALFKAGAGNIGNYADCSFTSTGVGSFTPGKTSNPVIGTRGSKTLVEEAKIEVIFPTHITKAVVSEMLAAHPYEEVAYDLFEVQNTRSDTGSGLIGVLSESMETNAFLQLLKDTFGVRALKHTALLHEKVKTIALCGGAGSFLLKNAIAYGADVYITSDVKYHEFFDADNKTILVDIGHYESEQFTIDLIYDKLTENFINFAILKTGLNTNPVFYFEG